MKSEAGWAGVQRKWGERQKKLGCSRCEPSQCGSGCLGAPGLNTVLWVLRLWVVGSVEGRGPG